MSRRIGLSEPVLEGNEGKYLLECVESGWISSAGPFVARFEEEIARRLEAKHAVATASGTAALHLALIACGVSANDEVILPSVTFIAPANAVRYVGAHPVFVDVDRATLQLDVEAVREFLETETVPSVEGVINRRTGRPVRAILPVHLLGHPVDMDALLELAKRFGLRVIEDASEAMGARYRGRSVGALGDVGCMSFNGNKTITCGGGGMFLTDDGGMAALARHLSTQARVSGEEFIHDRVGYNYRLTNLQAAVGLAQVEALERFLAAKVRIQQFYREELAVLPGVEMVESASWAESSYWLSAIRLSRGEGGVGPRDVRRSLSEQQIETRPLWQPLHLSPAMQPAQGFPACPQAEAAYEECLCLPSTPSLSDGDLERVASAIRSALRNSQRS